MNVSPLQEKPVMPDVVEFKISLSDLQVIDAALSEMPYRIAAPVILRINQQLQKGATQEESGAS